MSQWCTDLNHKNCKTGYRNFVCTRTSILTTSVLEHMGSLAIPQSDTSLTLFTYLFVFLSKTSLKNFSCQKNMWNSGRSSSLPQVTSSHLPHSTLEHARCLDWLLGKNVCTYTLQKELWFTAFLGDWGDISFWVFDWKIINSFSAFPLKLVVNQCMLEEKIMLPHWLECVAPKHWQVAPLWISL